MATHIDSMCITIGNPDDLTLQVVNEQTVALRAGPVTIFAALGTADEQLTALAALGRRISHLAWAEISERRDGLVVR